MTRASSAPDSASVKAPARVASVAPSERPMKGAKPRTRTAAPISNPAPADATKDPHDAAQTERDAFVARTRAAAQQQPVPPMPPGQLRALLPRFGLATFEADVLSLLWVTAYDADLRAACLDAGGERSDVTVALAARLFGHPPRVRLASESPLLLWRMVKEHPRVDGNAALAIDPLVIAWLDRAFELDRVLVGHLNLLAADVELASWPLDAAAQRIDEGLRQMQRWRVHLRTDDAPAALAFAAGLGRRLGQPVIAVAPSAFPPDALADAAVHLHRQAFFDGCVPCFAVADAALSRPHGVVPYPLQIVYGDGPLGDAAAGVQTIDWTLAAPDANERAELWRHALPSSAAWPRGALADLALRHEGSLTDIAAAAATQPADASQAAHALRTQRRSDLAPLARRSEAGFTWDDLVLPDDVKRRLQAIAFEARERSRVWAEPEAARLFPYGRGLTALFAGVPGTGKSMAAHGIAADLGLDLLTVDISAVVSKWVGETAQHLQQLLSSPAARRGVLFFDEADALYGRRVDEVRDAQDRMANLDTSHLMTALEAFPGIVLMASNLKANIDSAFVRRIRHVVDFPKPDAEARVRLWQRVVGGLFAPQEAKALEPLLPRVARIEATGAVIKNAALSALFAARERGRAPDLRLLGEMLTRELSKEGAGLSARELEAMLEASA